MGLSYINVLDPKTSMKIAAGEVIDRPSSVVRELIDNALDANATRIFIDVEKGGRDFLAVHDNGIGMSEEDLKKSYLNHATSKIDCFDDLSRLKTFGFRGEALASIGEISHVTLASCIHNEKYGSELWVKFGVAENTKPKGMNPGTIISISKFFENVPARLKFLSSESSEYRMIVQEVIKKALAKPQVSFELVHNHKTKYHLSPTQELVQRVIDIFPDLQDMLEAFVYEKEGIYIYGFLSKPSWYRSSRSYQYFFVNGRAIDWMPFRIQISLAYNNLLPPAKFPAVFCYVEVDPSRIDFNVHPQKREIRFENETVIADAVRRAMRNGIDKSLENKDLLSILNSSSSNLQLQFLGDRGIKSRSTNISVCNELAMDVQQSQFFHKKVQQDNIYDLLEEARYIGTMFSTYLLFEYSHMMFLVDFHAMHERIRYESILRKQNEGVESQGIIPICFKLSKAEAEIFEEIESSLNILGFHLHRISDTEFLVEAIPVLVDIAYVQTVLRELFCMDMVMSVQKSYVWDSVCKIIACRGSAHAGDKINSMEVQQLLEDWKKCEYRHSCPHGRPIVISMDKKYFDKEFKRTGF